MTDIVFIAFVNLLFFLAQSVAIISCSMVILNEIKKNNK